MALARVQVSTVATVNGWINVATSFPVSPTVGNGIAVIFTAQCASILSSTITCVDNRGHTYTLAISRVNGNAQTLIFYLSKVVTNTAPFTITLTFGGAGPNVFANGNVIAIEVGGVITGLAPANSTGSTGASQAIVTGAMTALAISETFLVAAFCQVATLTGSTVEVVSPIWTEEYEQLSVAYGPGEINSRILTSASGTTPSCSWTVTGAGVTAVWASAIVAFKDGIASGGGGARSLFIWS